MNADVPGPDSPAKRFSVAWERFWFSPMDPTLLGLIRICTGLIVVYSLATYSFDLDAFFGANGWMDLTTRLDRIQEWPVVRTPLRGQESPLPPPRNERQQIYLEAYKKEFNALPPGPYPRDDQEMEEIHKFRREFGFDLRLFGLPPPATTWERQYLWDYASRNKLPPGPPYPKNEEEAQRFQEYLEHYGQDPRLILTKGMPVWSVFFHLTDPGELRLFHAAAIGIAVLFLIGFCTRVTTVVLWFVTMCYIHRSPHILFGADTMQNILLLYLMIGPSGAAVSVDRLIAGWWSRNKLAVVNRWRGLWEALLGPDELAPSAYQATPQASVLANFAIRLLQIHLCIIYFVAGISKLQGTSWWAGTAVWAAIANYEFVPMQFPWYLETLRFIGHNDFVFKLFLCIGTYFTLVFEISYPFLIWQPLSRWIVLASAAALHGFIGTLMGLKTFALIMLVMNMAFLQPREAQWIVNRLWPK